MTGQTGTGELDKQISGPRSGGSQGTVLEKKVQAAPIPQPPAPQQGPSGAGPHPTLAWAEQGSCYRPSFPTPDKVAPGKLKCKQTPILAANPWF